MATPRRNTVDYFPHLIGYGKKMDFIEKRHGNDGYATWFKILESLATTDNHYLNLNDTIEVSFLSAKCNVDEAKLLDIINDLVRIKVFDKELWEYQVLWSQTFYDNIQDAYKRRATKPINLHTLCIHLVDIMILPRGFMHTSCKHNVSKTEDTVHKIPYIILDKSIVDNTIVDESEKKEKSPTQKFTGFGKQPIKKLKEDCAGHSTWLESIGMKNSLLMPQVLEWFEAFCVHLVSVGKEEETEQEFKRYCSSWISSEIRQGRKPVVENQSKNAPKKSHEEIAQEVIIKKYGNRAYEN